MTGHKEGCINMYPGKFLKIIDISRNFIMCPFWGEFLYVVLIASSYTHTPGPPGFLFSRAIMFISSSCFFWNVPLFLSLNHTLVFLFPNFSVLSVYGRPTMKDEGFLLIQHFIPPYTGIFFLPTPSTLLM